MKKHTLLLVGAAALMVAGTAGFMNLRPAGYRDGVYSGSASGAFGETKVTLTIADGRIAKCDMEALDDDGNVKDAHYGEGSSEANFRMAQTALQGIGEYPKKLIESQNVDGIDAVSGATVSLLDFRNAVKQALEEARR